MPSIVCLCCVLTEQDIREACRKGEETLLFEGLDCRICQNDIQSIVDDESSFSSKRCTLCGGARLKKPEGVGVCSFIGCKDPLFDLREGR